MLRDSTKGFRSDNDVYHHMNNSVYSFLIDSITNAYLIEHCGLKPASSQQIGLVVSSYCDYFGSVAYPALLSLGLRVVKLGKSSVLYEVGVFEQGQEDVKAVGGLSTCLCYRQTESPRKKEWKQSCVRAWRSFSAVRLQSCDLSMR